MRGYEQFVQGIDPALLQDVCVRDALAGLQIAEETLRTYESEVEAAQTEYQKAESRAKQGRLAFNHRKRLYARATDARVRAAQARDTVEVVEGEWRIAKRWLDHCLARARDQQEQQQTAEQQTEGNLGSHERETAVRDVPLAS